MTLDNIDVMLLQALFNQYYVDYLTCGDEEMEAAKWAAGDVAHDWACAR